MTENVPTLHEVLAGNARRLRGSHRTEHVARAMRAYGLRWTDSNVSALERGKVAPSLGNLVPLSLGFRDLLERPVSLSELLSHDGLVRLNDEITMQGSKLAALFGDESVTLTRDDVADEDADRRIAAHLAAGPAQRETFRLLNAVYERRGHPDPETERRAEQLVGTAEERAAADLGVDVWLLVGTAAALWGRPFSEERDDRAGHDANAQRRGQVTRRMKTELAAEIEAVRNGDA